MKNLAVAYKHHEVHAN